MQAIWNDLPDDRKQKSKVRSHVPMRWGKSI